MTLSSNPKPVSEQTDDEAIEALVAELRLIPDGDKPSIIGSSEFSTVNEAIDHLERRTPTGMHILGLHRRVHETIARVPAEKEQNPGVVGKIRGAIQRLFS